MFVREFPIIDSAVSVDQLRMRLKDNELEQYGESFIPEFVYEIIRRLPRFSTMRVSSMSLNYNLILTILSVGINRTQKNFWDFFSRRCMRNVVGL